MRVGIVGGGISGLACAYYLWRAGIEALVFDPTPGGLIGTVRTEGCILEAGPESWLASKPWAEQLIRELGMGDQLTGSNDARRRTYVLRDGRFVALPEGLQLVVPTRLIPLLRTEPVHMGHEGPHGHGGLSKSKGLAGSLRLGVRRRSFWTRGGGLPRRAASRGRLRRFARLSERRERFAQVRRTRAALRKCRRRRAAGEGEGNRSAGFQVAAQRNGFADRCASRNRHSDSRAVESIQPAMEEYSRPTNGTISTRSCSAAVPIARRR